MSSTRVPHPGLPDGVPLLVVTRGREVESMHRGSVAVVDEAGRLLGSAGDPLQEVFLRSAAKPFQLTPLLAAGGERRFGLSTREIAVGAASHGGEAFHTEVVSGLLAKGGFTVEDLHCGAHPPMHAGTAAELAGRRERPSPLQNNCSGKHAAMLLACRVLGESPDRYWTTEHPLHDRILKVLSRMTAVSRERIGIAVDGCSIPVFRLPLYNLALGYARLVGERVAGESVREASARARIVGAMRDAPEMVAGTGRFTTNLMREYAGTIVGKEGAEGTYAMSVPAPSRADRPAGGAVGIALKIEDGSERGRDAVAVEVLRQMGLAAGARLRRLRRFAHRPVRNARGDVVGGMRTVFALHRFPAPGAEAP